MYIKIANWTLFYITIINKIYNAQWKEGEQGGVKGINL